MDDDGRTVLGEWLCEVEFAVAGGIVALGDGPLGSSRVGYITGGRFAGPRLTGVVLPGGGNWSRTGRLASGAQLGTFDARSLWRTDDGALISITYTGRSVVPEDVRAAWAVPGATVDPARYYLRIAPVFETADARYDWLNGIVAIGRGERTADGVRHQLFTVG